LSNFNVVELEFEFKFEPGDLGYSRTSEQSATLEEKIVSEWKSEGEGFIFVVLS
jgi:hypothetical protein